MRKVKEETIVEKTKGQGSGFVAGVIAGAVVAAAGGYLVWSRTDSRTPPAAIQQSPPAATLPPLIEMSPSALASVERISPDGLKDLMDRGEATIIDVRDVETYSAGHIPGALQIPLQYVAGEIPYFPRDKKLITYCT